MTFLAIFFALLFEQVRPLGAHSLPHQLARLWVQQVLRGFDAGQRSTAHLAWALIVLLPALLATLAHHLLRLGDNWMGWGLLFALHVAVLYMTLGFRQFSAYFSSIRDALDAGDETSARATLSAWAYTTPDAALPQRSDILRCTLAQASVSAHIHVFGVMLAYGLGVLLGLGPAGAIAYRMGELLARSCNQQNKQHPQNPQSQQNSAPNAETAPAALGTQHPISTPMQSLSQNAWHLLNWLPTRITALLFAIVGNFEDAIACWRAQTQQAVTEQQKHDNSPIIISAAAGAIGVQMGLEPQANGSSNLNPPQLGHLQAMVGLVWRAVVVAMTFLALMTVAGIT
jgi:adenosylcobinamide-phosphate synthase